MIVVLLIALPGIMLFLSSVFLLIGIFKKNKALGFFLLSILLLIIEGAIFLRY